MRSCQTAIKRLMTVGVVLALVAGAVRLYNDYRLSTIRNELFQLDQCQFYAGDDQTRSQDPDEMRETIKKILMAGNIKCQNRSVSEKLLTLLILDHKW